MAARAGMASANSGEGRGQAAETGRGAMSNSEHCLRPCESGLRQFFHARPAAIRKLCETFAGHREHYRSGHYNEALSARVREEPASYRLKAHRGRQGKEKPAYRLGNQHRAVQGSPLRGVSARLGSPLHPGRVSSRRHGSGPVLRERDHRCGRDQNREEMCRGRSQTRVCGNRQVPARRSYPRALHRLSVGGANRQSAWTIQRHFRKTSWSGCGFVSSSGSSRSRRPSNRDPPNHAPSPARDCGCNR